MAICLCGDLVLFEDKHGFVDFVGEDVFPDALLWSKTLIFGPWLFHEKNLVNASAVDLAVTSPVGLQYPYSGGAYQYHNMSV